MAILSYSPLLILLSIALLGMIAFLILWDKPVIIIYLQLLYICIMNFLISELRFPSIIRYIPDILTLLLFLQLILNRRINLNVNLKKPFYSVVLFTIIVSVPFIMGRASFVFLIWGVRVIYRAFIFFSACVFFLTRKDVDNLLYFFVYLMPINMLVCCYQFFVQGYKNDAVSGIFLFNGYVSIHLILVIATLISFYTVGKINIYFALAGFIMVLFTAVLAELKAMFFFLPIILLIITVLAFPNKRAIFLLSLGSAFSSLAIPIMIIFYPSWADFFTSESMYNYAAEIGYGGRNAVSRLSAGSYLLENVLLTPGEKLFGVGLGNASHFFAFYSPFFLKNWMLYYQSFTYSVLIAEVGLLGLGAYLMLLISIIIDSVRISFSVPPKLKRYSYITIATTILSIILMVYNSTFLVDFVYMVFFVFAIPYIIEKEENKSLISTPINL